MSITGRSDNKAQSADQGSSGLLLLLQLCMHPTVVADTWHATLCF